MTARIASDSPLASILPASPDGLPPTKLDLVLDAVRRMIHPKVLSGKKGIIIIIVDNY